MADITLRFKMNHSSGKREITVEYESDDDELPHEHEKRHKEIFDNLVKRGQLDPNAKVVFERVKPKKVQTGPQDSGPAKRAGAAQG